MHAKKIVLGLLFLLLYLFTLTGVSYAAQQAAPQNTVKTGEAVQNEASDKESTGSAMQKSVYILPYPGILPDHPLFFLKKLRDSVIEMLIADQVRKSEFYLLQADKHLNAGIFLYEKGNKDLAIKTITLSSDFMKRSVDGLQSIKAGGREIPASVVEKLEQSTGKHIEVLTEMAGSSDASAKEGLDSSLTLIKSLQEVLPNLK